jgi:hypothetical protein
MQAKPNDIKKHVTYGNKTSSPAYLAVNEVGGELWATNRYWLTRAERVAPLLEQYNLPAGEPGVYQVNGTVSRTGDQVPNVAAYVKNLKNFTPGIRVHVGGQPALARGGTGVLFALYVLADGSHAGLLENELDWLSDIMTAPKLPDGYRYGDVRVSFHKTDAGKPPQAMIRTEVVHTIEPGHYADKVEGQTVQEYVPAVTEPGEPVVLGYMMGVSYGA